MAGKVILRQRQIKALPFHLYAHLLTNKTKCREAN